MRKEEMLMMSALSYAEDWAVNVEVEDELEVFDLVFSREAYRWGKDGETVLEEPAEVAPTAVLAAVAEQLEKEDLLSPYWQIVTKRGQAILMDETKPIYSFSCREGWKNLKELRESLLEAYEGLKGILTAGVQEAC